MIDTERALKADLKRLNMLRNDAISLGLQEVAIVYGWSAIRVSGEIIQLQLAGLMRPI